MQGHGAAPLTDGPSPDAATSAAPDAEALKQRAWRGVRLLLGRQAVTRLLGLAGAVVLARKLAPSDFGLFGIVSFIAGVLGVFGDLGFAAFFIQAEQPLGERDVHVCFTTQLLFTTAVVVTIWLVAPWAMHFYPVPSSAVWMTRVLALTVYIDVFRSVYRMQLERELNYAPIARGEILETGVNVATAVTLALAGYGVWSFVMATIAGEVVAAAMFASQAPIAARFRLDVARMRELLPRTIGFQAYAPVNALGDAATPTVIGILLGPAAVGFLNQASANARRPLVFVEAVARVSFPHFSRAKQDRALLRETIVDYLGGFVWIVLLWGAVAAVAAGPGVELVYSAKWLPAVPALIVFALALPLDSVSWLMGQAFAAVNRPFVPTAIVAGRSIFLFALAVVLVRPLGLLSIPVAYFAANLVTAPLQLRLFEPGLVVMTLRRCAWMAIPAILAVLAGRGGLFMLGRFGWFGPLIRLIAASVPGVAVYVLASFVLAPARYRSLLAGLRSGRRQP